MGKGIGKGNGACPCWNCEKFGHQFRNCPEPQKKGKCKGYNPYGKGNWSQPGVRSPWSLKTVVPKVDKDGFAKVEPSKTANAVVTVAPSGCRWEMVQSVPEGKKKQMKM